MYAAELKVGNNFKVMTDRVYEWENQNSKISISLSFKSFL